MKKIAFGLEVCLMILLAFRGGHSLPGNPIRTFTLDNGLQLILKEEHEKNLVAVNAYVKGGSRTETPELSGLSHYYEHLIFRGGTARQAELETRKAFQALGSFHGFTSDDVTCYYIVTTRENLDEALWRHADAVMNLDLIQEKVDLERQVVMEEYNMDWDRPDYRSYYLLMETVYRAHPYRITPIGTKDVILNSDLERFRTFYEERYVPNQIVIACVGDFDTAEMLGKIEALWGTYPRGKDSFELGTEEPRQEGFREASIGMVAAHSYMIWGFHIPEAASFDIPVLDVLNTILSDGENSRLYRALKVEESLALAVTSYVERRKDPGILAIDIQLQPENEAKTVEVTFRELLRIAEEGVTDEELAAAKTKIANDYDFSHQSFIEQAQSLCAYAANADIVLESAYLDLVRKTTRDDIVRVARAYLRPTNCSIATVRPEGAPATSFAGIAAGLTFPPVSEAVAAKHPATRKVLKNGLTFISQSELSSNTVAIEVNVKGGLLVEKEEKNGICNLISRCLLKGTKEKDAVRIAQEIDSLGIRLEASSFKDFSSLSLLSTPENILEATNLLLEIITRPAFPAEEVDKVKEEVLAEIRSLPDRSYDLTNREFARKIFKWSPYRMPVIGDENTVSGLSSGDLGLTHRWLYVPSNMVVAVVGAFTEEEIRDVEASFAAIPSGRVPRLNLRDEPYQPELQVETFPLDKTQVTFNIGTMGVGLSDPDYLPLKLVERVLASRLFFKYVYEEGIAYRMWTYMEPRLLSIPFTFEMGVSSPNFQKGRDGILSEVREVLESGVTADELDIARKNMVTGFHLKQETHGGRAQHMAFYEMAGLGFDFPDKIQEKLDAVTTERVDRVARMYLSPDRYTMVVVGKVSE